MVPHRQSKQPLKLLLQLVVRAPGLDQGREQQRPRQRFRIACEHHWPSEKSNMNPQFVRIGTDQLINVAAVVKVVDEGLKKLSTGETVRVATVALASGGGFHVGGTEADAVWTASLQGLPWPSQLTPVKLAIHVGVWST
jgi:hypothetical protein